MQTKLIKLKEGYIIVSNQKEVNGYFPKILTNEYTIEQSSDSEDLDWYIKNGGKIIIASDFIPELPNIDFNNLEKKFGIINVEKLAKTVFQEKTDKIPIPTSFYMSSLWYYEQCFIEGFNKCLEFNKDKLYTEKDIKNAIKWLTKNYSKVEDELAHPLETNQVELPDNFFENVYEEALNRAIQSLQPKTEWDIEVEKTENSIKIIK